MADYLRKTFVADCDYCTYCHKCLLELVIATGFALVGMVATKLLQSQAAKERVSRW